MALQRGLTAKTVNAGLHTAGARRVGAFWHRLGVQRLTRAVARRVRQPQEGRKKHHRLRKVGYKPMALRLLPE
jgi:hypothetical protein